MALTTVTRVAHACVLLDFDGHTILTDPWLSERTGYYQGEKRAFDTAIRPATAGRRGDQPRALRLIRHGRVRSLPRQVGPDGRQARAGSEGPVLRVHRRHRARRRGDRRPRPGPDHRGPGETPLPINGLTIRPLLNRQVVMNAVEAAELTRVLRPRLAVPIHYAFTGGPIRDRFLLKKAPDPRCTSTRPPTSPRTPDPRATPRRAPSAARTDASSRPTVVNHIRVSPPGKDSSCSSPPSPPLTRGSRKSAAPRATWDVCSSGWPRATEPSTAPVVTSGPSPR